MSDTQATLVYVVGYLVTAALAAWRIHTNASSANDDWLGATLAVVLGLMLALVWPLVWVVALFGALLHHAKRRVQNP